MICRCLSELCVGLVKVVAIGRQLTLYGSLMTAKVVHLYSSCEHKFYSLLFVQALQLVTVIVGAKRPPADKCRLITAADVSEKKEEEFPVPEYPSESDIASETLMPRPVRWSAYFKGVVALMNKDGKVPPFDALIVTCVPLGGGLSSSAALEVATCFFIEELCKKAGVPQPVRRPEEKALLCQLAEHMYAHMPCGIMDQFVSVMGQANKALFIDCR